MEEQYFAVRSNAANAICMPTEMDVIENRCRELRQLMRERPTLPLKADGAALTASDLETGMKLPLCSCPFRRNEYGPCHFHTSDRDIFLHHIAGGARDDTHARELAQICKDDISWMTNLDYVYRAMAIAERERWPMLGLSTTRRSLNQLVQRYNDETTECLACFICGQLRTTCAGYPPVVLESSSSSPSPANVEIRYWKEAVFQEVEKQFPGTLLNNCGFDLWQKRYVDRNVETSKAYPWKGQKLLSEPLSTCIENRERHVSRWAVQFSLGGRLEKLIGCT